MLGKVRDVVTLIAVFGRGLAECASGNGLTELVHLHTTVVDIELTHHCGARRSEHACDCITDNCPARMTQVQWSGRIGADEFHIDRLAGQHIAVSVVAACGNDVSHEFSGSGCADGEVDESRPGNFHLGELSALRKCIGNQRGTFTRIQANRFRQDHGDVGRPVAVLTALRPINGDTHWDCGFRDGARCHEVADCIANHISEQFRCHTGSA